MLSRKSSWSEVTWRRGSTSSAQPSGTENCPPMCRYLYDKQSRWALKSLSDQSVRKTQAPEYPKQVPMEFVFGLKKASVSGLIYRYDEQTATLRSTANDMYRTVETNERVLTEIQSNSARSFRIRRAIPMPVWPRVLATGLYMYGYRRLRCTQKFLLLMFLGP